MLGTEIMAQARTIAGDEDGRRFIDPLMFNWIDAGARRLVDETEILQDGIYRTLVDGAKTSSLTVVVDDTQDFKVGDRIDFITAAGVKEATNCRITSITPSTQTLTLAAAVTVGDNSQVWFRNDKGSIDLVASTADYFTPWSAMRIKQVRIKHSSSSSFRVIPQLEQRQTALGRAQNAGWPSSSERATWVQGYIQLGREVIQLYPAPGDAITDGMVVTFVRRPMYLVKAEDEPEFDESYHGALIHWCAAQMFMMDKDAESAQAQMAMFQTYVDMGRKAQGFPADLPSIHPQSR